MKTRIFSFFFCALILISNLSLSASAQESIVSSTIEYFEDGSYLVTTITESVSRASTKSGSKTTTYHNSSNETQWTYKITGTFSYTGSSATCTAVSDSYTIVNDNWHMSSHSCSKSGNTASGTVTMKYKVLGITFDTVSDSLTLTCSSTGVLS